LSIQDLSFKLAKQCDIRNEELAKHGKPHPHQSFREEFYRQPALTENPVYPEPYRKVGGSGFLAPKRNKLGTNYEPGAVSSSPSSTSTNNPLHKDLEFGQQPQSSSMFEAGSNIDSIMRYATLSSDDVEESGPDRGSYRKTRPALTRGRSRSININAVPDEVEDDQKDLEEYFHQVVLPLTRTRTRTNSK
jgi:hypothetical protein